MKCKIPLKCSLKSYIWKYQKITPQHIDTFQTSIFSGWSYTVLVWVQEGQVLQKHFRLLLQSLSWQALTIYTSYQWC